MSTQFMISNQVIEDLVNGKATYLTPEKRQESLLSKITRLVKNKPAIYSARLHANELVICKDRVEFNYGGKLLCTLSFQRNVDFNSGETVTILLPDTDFKLYIS